MSCNIKVSVSGDFAKEAKRLTKKYPSFKQDYIDFLESIKENPLQGDEITKNIRKVRMAIKSKGKGKSGGARVITLNILTKELCGEVVLLLIYDKEDASTVKTSAVKELVRSLGFATAMD
jgi:mRNA-degrading endonuclease RelE of RelBE toxin-antitoxin system